MSLTLDAASVDNLISFVDRRVRKNGCDHTHRFSEEWAHDESVDWHDLDANTLPVKWQAPGSRNWQRLPIVKRDLYCRGLRLCNLRWLSGLIILSALASRRAT